MSLLLILYQGVAGGAVFPPIQGAVADSGTTRISMVIPMCGFVYVFGYCFFHWFTHGRNFRRVKDIVVAADTAGRKGSTWGGALGGAINYIHYTGEKETADIEGGHGRRASIVTHGRRSSVAVQVKRPSVSHGMVIEEEQRGNPILL
jgi:FHS family L-fucose permease-like MFS transporter